MESTVKPAVSILLVEDEEVTLKLLAAILAKKFPQAAIYPAADGRTGLQLFREHRPDIVITDVNMPEMSGIQMACAMRATRAGLKIIVLTAGPDNSDTEPADGAATGVDHYILKPIDFAVLFAAIESCLADIAAHRGPPGDWLALGALLDALEGDQQALLELIGDFLVSYPAQLDRIADAIRAGDARHLEKSAHHFKGCLGIFCRNEPLALTQRLLEMGEQETLSQAPETLQLLQREMEQLVTGLREFASR